MLVTLTALFTLPAVQEGVGLPKRAPVWLSEESEALVPLTSSNFQYATGVSEAGEAVVLDALLEIAEVFGTSSDVFIAK